MRDITFSGETKGQIYVRRQISKGDIDGYTSFTDDMTDKVHQHVVAKKLSP
ncbi:MAG: hypothetical protein QF704_11165 [Anaerolineales bacterium]|nr:hypothetical protein [Anaerolineales bacterium]